MRILSSCLLVVSLVATPPFLEGSKASADTWKAGLARVDITPTESMWMAGYAGRNRPSEGTLHPLWVKVVALEDAQGNKGVIVTSDILGFPRGLSEAIWAELEEKYDLEKAQVMLTASHTHTGPVLSEGLLDIYPVDDEQMKRIDEYTQELKGKIVAVVGEALADMRPVVLSASEGSTDFAANRRNNSEASVVQLRAEGKATVGPSDHAVPVLAVKSPDGGLLAVVFGYACHCTTLSDYDWSGDHAGFAQIELEKAIPGCQAMFWAGCGADQNPIPRRSVELCEKYGKMMCSAVQEALGKDMRPVEPKLQTRFEFIDIPFGNEVSLEEWKARTNQGGWVARWARRHADALEAGETLATSYSYPIQVWKLGESQLWVVLGGEVVVDYALSFKKLFGENTWVAGYSNDCMAYIPSDRIRREGGYEAGAFNVYGLPTDSWCEDIEERITKTTEKLIQSFE